MTHPQLAVIHLTLAAAALILTGAWILRQTLIQLQAMRALRRSKVSTATGRYAWNDAG